MDKCQIKAGQLFAMSVLFQVGTALVVNLGSTAGHDVWIAILLGMVVGVVLFICYTIPYRVFPQMLPSTYINKLTGKYIGPVISMAYVIFFMNKASRDVMDGGLLITMSTLRETPLFIINLVMVLSIAYVLSKGIEVLARTAVIFMVIVLILLMMVSFLSIASNIVDFGRLLPIMGKGFQPIVMSVIKGNYQFPFAETICFTMILPLLGEQKKGIVAGVSSIITSGLIYAFVVMLVISASGIDIAKRSTFPLLTMVGSVSVSEFIQRVDILVVMILVIGDFFKISIFYYAVVIGLSDLFKISYQKLVYPIGIIIVMFSQTLARSYTEHIMKGTKVLPTIDPIFYVLLPLLLIILTWVYKIRSRGSS